MTIVGMMSLLLSISNLVASHPSPIHPHPSTHPHTHTPPYTGEAEALAETPGSTEPSPQTAQPWWCHGRSPGGMPVLISHDITWLHKISHDFTRYHMTSHGITWHHMVSHDITWYHMTSHDITWSHMITHDTLCSCTHHSNMCAVSPQEQNLDLRSMLNIIEAFLMLELWLVSRHPPHKYNLCTLPHIPAIPLHVQTETRQIYKLILLQ